MSRFCPLFSSSKGNSILLSSGGTTLLIDAGISFRGLRSALDEQGYHIDDIDGILITHEHSDHIKGLCTLLKKTGAPLFATPKTLEHLWVNGYIPPGAQARECGDSSFAVGEIEVSAFDTPHDAVSSVGYRFALPDSRVVAIATDLGHISETVRASLMGCDLVMLESNYDKGMLDCSSYPYTLKRRIKSDFGHLSNDDCSGMLLSLIKSGVTRFVLGHLSEQNNIPELALETARSVLRSASLKENLDYTLDVAPARGKAKAVVF